MTEFPARRDMCREFYRFRPIEAKNVVPFSAVLYGSWQKIPVRRSREFFARSREFRQALRQWGIDPEELTVGFDHPDENGQFTLPNGREIPREPDGYYWVTEHEWGLAQHIFGVNRIN